MFGFKHGRLGSAGTRTLIQRAIASLRARGTDAHLWLPGVGTLNGLTTGNYLESTGNTLATVDNPTGLVLDALGTVGAELVTANPMFISIDASFVASASGGVATAAPSGALIAFFPSSGPVFVGGKAYQITVTISSFTSGAVSLLFTGGATESLQMTATTTFTVKLDAGSTGVAYLRPEVAGTTLTVGSISVREVSGIHLTQSTTANKGLLKQDAGSRYYWLFDATDLLTGTFPAGYESVTVIDAKSTGQVTTSAANVVGSYSIGPSYSSYGRIIINGSITASELALYQGFANRLAGL